MKPLKVQLLDFLNSVNEDFNPPLTEKVCLEEYVKKITEKAELIIEYVDDDIVGMVVLYCNDVISGIAYIPFCAVRKEFRGKGIAKSLMMSAINKVQERKLSTLAIHSNNPIAIKLYQDLGFQIVEGDVRVYLQYKIV
jgi:ribosomal protein S18 acetylase RimI-like enzyme